MSSINLLKRNTPKKTRKQSRRVFTYVLILSIAGLFLFFAITTKHVLSNNSFQLGKLNVFSQVQKIVTEVDEPLYGEIQGRINVLLLGIGGAEHEGTQLTDTIMIASLLPEEGKVALISIPRDLLVPIPGYGWRKINSVNAFAEQTAPGSGAQKTTELLSDLFDIPIHYYVRIDFEGFIKLIDDFGGLEIFVENTLDDYQYPIRGKENDYPIESRFEHLHIEEGWQQMDGALALKYVRSRHAQGIEGSDFSRSKRQQKVLSAFKKKVLSIGTAFSPSKISSLIEAYNTHVSTDVSVSDGLKLIELVKPIEEDDVFRLVLDNSEEGPLQNATITDKLGNKAYILRPKTGDFLHIQNLVKEIFNQENKDIQLALALSEEPLIELQHAQKDLLNTLPLVKQLENDGFTHLSLEKNIQPQTKEPVIYDFTNGRKYHTISYLKSLLPHALIITSASLNQDIANSTDTNILVLLGTETSL